MPATDAVVRGFVILAAMATVALATACGASHATQTSTSTTAKQNGAVAYAGCLRSNGVPKWPDPNSGGVFDKSKLTLQQLGVSSSRLQAAETACRHLLPNGGRAPNATQFREVKTLGYEFARCVRSHGVANFPDPDASGRIPDPASVGIEQASPTFEAANQACGKYRPPYMPSNSAYNTYAQAHGN